MLTSKKNSSYNVSNSDNDIDNKRQNDSKSSRLNDLVSFHFVSFGFIEISHLTNVQINNIIDVAKFRTLLVSQSR